eukprot:scaffold246883_cov62-Attheya_sp.AAC.3
MKTEEGKSSSYEWLSTISKVKMLFVITVVMQVATDLRKKHSATFDTDSGLMSVDNRCSGCISHIAEDFIGELRDSGQVLIKGFGGTKTTGIKIGTLLWKWCNNEGQVHTFKIPNSFYVPQGGVQLLIKPRGVHSRSALSSLLKSWARLRRAFTVIGCRRCAGAL